MALALAAMWLAYWTYRYWTRPVPDEEMIGVVALAVAIWPAAFFAIGWVLVRTARLLLRLAR